MRPHQRRMLEAALGYAQEGWPVVLIHGIVRNRCTCRKIRCRSPGKHPITQNGVNDATTDLKQIKMWLKEHPDANIAVATGELSGLLVLDVDPRNGGNRTLKQIKQAHGDIPPTIMSMTGGGGRHILFAYPRFPVKKDNAGRLFGDGIDVQSDGCYAIMPPSRHPSGQTYTWFDGLSHDEIELAELPEALAKLLKSSVTKDAKATLLAPPAEAFLEGHRNSRLAQIAGEHRRRGASESIIRAILTVVNQEHCRPPLDQWEVDGIAASVATYPTGAINSTSSDIAHGIMDAFLDRYFEGGRTLLYTTDGGFWRYDGKMWVLVQEEWLKGRILAFLEEMPHNLGRRHAGTMSEVLMLTRAKRASDDDVLRFRSEPPPVINCKNGELWLTDDLVFELRPHSPDSYLRHCHEIDHLPEALCPRFDAALEEIFAGSSNVKAMVRHILEVMGRTIFPDRSDPAITVFYGRGANGKTALLDIFINLLGPQLVHAGQLEEIEKNRFIHGNLLGKLMFVDDDVRAGAQLPDGALKKISERKLLCNDN